MSRLRPPRVGVQLGSLADDRRATRAGRSGARLLRAALLCAWVASPRAAAAAPAPAALRVAVLGVETRELSEALGLPLEFRRAVERALRRMPGLSLLPCKTLEEFKLVFGCLDEQAACMARGGLELGADRLLWGLLTPRGEQWLLRLQWFDVAAARGLSSVELSLPAMADRETIARALTPGLRRLLGLRLGTLVLRLPVSGVEVWVDGQRRPPVAGRLFRAAELPRGRHRVEVRKQGYLRWQREVQIAADLQTELVVALRLARAGAGRARRAAAGVPAAD